MSDDRPFLSDARPFLSEATHCPNCGAEWKYVEGVDTYSRLIGVYSREQDRTVAWACPGCAQRWPRNTRIETEGAPDA